MFKGDNVTLAHHNFSRLMVEFKPLSYRVHKEVHLGSITKANVGGKVAANLSMNALDVGACTWLPDASSRWPGRGENKAHGCFDRVTKSTKTRKQKKKESSLTAQGTRSTGPLRHSTLHQIWEVSPESGWWFNISGNTRWNGVQKRGGKIIYIYIILPPCRIGSCYLNTGHSWIFPPWRSSPIGGFALMYHLVHVEINISSFSGNGTDVCRNASLQSEVPKLAKKKKSKSSFCSVATFWETVFQLHTTEYKFENLTLLHHDE